MRVQDAQHAVVTLLARVNGNLMELGVPVYAASGGLGITGEPAWLPAPKSAVQPAPYRSGCGLRSTVDLRTIAPPPHSCARTAMTCSALRVRWTHSAP